MIRQNNVCRNGDNRHTRKITQVKRNNPHTYTTHLAHWRTVGRLVEHWRIVVHIGDEQCYFDSNLKLRKIAFNKVLLIEIFFKHLSNLEKIAKLHRNF